MLYRTLDEMVQITEKDVDDIKDSLNENSNNLLSYIGVIADVDLSYAKLMSNFKKVQS